MIETSHLESIDEIKKFRIMKKGYRVRILESIEQDIQVHMTRKEFKDDEWAEHQRDKPEEEIHKRNTDGWVERNEFEASGSKTVND